MELEQFINSWVESPWNLNEHIIVMLIASNPEITKKELAQRSRLTERYVDKLTINLKKGGWITRKKGFSKGARYQLTKKGRICLITLHPFFK